MHILQVMGGGADGGAETAFVDLVIALHQKGIKQTVVMKVHAGREQAFKSAGIDPILLPFRKWFDFSTKRRLKKIIEQEKPTIIQSWMNRATSFIPSQHNAVHVGWFGGYYNVANFKACDYLVGVTPDIVKHQVDSGWDKNFAHVMRTFSTIDDQGPIDRALLDTPKDAKVLLNLARLHPKKAIDILLKALVDVPHAYLWLAGEGPDREKLICMAKDLKVFDRVRFLGWRTDRAALMRSADICVFPSRYEPFGTVIVEAWAYKIPLVTAASAGPKAHVINKHNGLIVEIDDVKGLSDAINLALTDEKLCQKMVEQGWSDYQENFTPDAVTTKYIAFYKSLKKRSH